MKITLTVEIDTNESLEDVKDAIQMVICKHLPSEIWGSISFLPESLDSDTKSKMTNLKVVRFDSESLEFDNGIVLSSYHNQDCCESHYLSLSDLTMADFEGLEFDLSNDNFFERIEDYGIALKPIVGFPVRIPAYGYNNGYYSSDLTLTISNGKNLAKSFDITECQSISG